MGARNVLEQLYSALESDAQIVALTGHTPGARSINTGARIIGDAVRLRPHPIPGIVIGLGSRTAGRGGPTQTEKTWLLLLTVYARDVFELAAIVDAIDAWSVNARWNAAGVRRVFVESVQQFETTDEQAFIAAAVNLNISYTGG